jgi:hypothetical protein
MLLERTLVSRKTPLDGKLEVTAETAARLAAVGDALAVVVQGATGNARVESMTCTCAKRAGERHVHHFVESPILKSLVAGSEVRLELTLDSATLRIESLMQPQTEQPTE